MRFNAHCFLAFLLFSYCPLGLCQEAKSSSQSVLDSFKVLSSRNPADLEVLFTISIQEKNPDSILKYADLLVKQSLRDSIHYKMVHNGYLQKGNAYRLKGDLARALEEYFKSMDFALKINYHAGIGKLYIAIADSYSGNKNSTNAAIYYKKGIEVLSKGSDSLSLAKALINIGDEYFNTNQLDSALTYTTHAEVIFKNINSPLGQAFSLGNIGMVYAVQGRDELAKTKINEAIKILEKLQDYYPISNYLTYMSDIYLRQGQRSIAVSYAKKSLELAQRYGLKEQISDANLKLYELYQKINDHPKALIYFKAHIQYRDSMNNIESVQKMADFRTNFEVSQKQIEVDLLHQEKKNQQIIVFASLIAFGLIFLIAIIVYRRYVFMKKANLIIERERNRSENLLLNILPEATAQELKQSGKVLAKKFESVTVLFTDFKDFSNFAEKLSPEKLVERVDFYFSKFDEIIGKYDLEKIKTLGDAYMCAGGLPSPTPDHATKMIQAAIEIAKFVRDSKISSSTDDPFFDIRIGINTGPVVAGIVGTKKFAYDIWGDTVNIAARMESNSVPGKINISENTYDLIKHTHTCEYRGEIEVKNKGMMKMYFVNESE